MHAILTRLGAEVRTRREARGLTKAQLAQVSDVSLRFLNDVEAGRANPSVLKVQALAEALVVDASVDVAM